MWYLLYLTLFVMLWFLTLMFFSSVDWLGVNDITPEEMQLVRTMLLDLQKSCTHRMPILVGPWVHNRWDQECVVLLQSQDFDTFAQTLPTYLTVTTVVPGQHVLLHHRYSKAIPTWPWKRAMASHYPYINLIKEPGSSYKPTQETHQFTHLHLKWEYPVDKHYVYSSHIHARTQNHKTAQDAVTSLGYQLWQALLSWRT